MKLWIFVSRRVALFGGACSPLCAALLLAGFIVTLAPGQALATTRQWTGNSGSPFAWSAANNWSPTGAPQAGDDLVFQNMFSSSNDMSGVVVLSMSFHPPNSGSITLRGLAVTVTAGISGNGSGSSSFDVQCPIILGGNQLFSYDGTTLRFSGGIDLSGHQLTINATSGNGSIFVGAISGLGSINTGGSGTIHCFGANNTFTGTLRVTSGIVQFEKNSGQLAIPATGRLEIAAGATVRLQGNDQISSAVVLENSGQFLLNGFSQVLSGGLTLWGGAVVDCGNNYGMTSLSVLNSLTVRATNSPAVIRGGIVALSNAPITFNIGGPASPALEISANLIGTGFTKTGAGVLRLSGTNSYVGDVIVQQGIVEAFHGTAFGATSGGVQLNGGSIRLNIGLGIGAERLTANGAALQLTNDLRQAIFGAGLFMGDDCSWSGPVILNTNLFVFCQSGTTRLFGTISGTAGMLLSGSTFELSGSSANTYTGETFVSGTVNLVKARAVGGALVVGTTDPGNSIAVAFVDNAVGGTAVRVNQKGSYALNGFNQTLTELTLVDGGSVATDAGTLSFSGNSTVMVGSLSVSGSLFGSAISGNIQLPSAATLTCSVRRFGSVGIFGPELDIPATISGSGTVVKNGPGKMRFKGSNISAGDIIVNDGALILFNPGAVGDTSFPIVVNNSGRLALEATAIPGIFYNGKTLILNSSNVGGPTQVVAFENMNGSNTWNGPIILSRDSGISVDIDNSYLHVPTTVSGPGGLIKFGPGTLQFFGFSANTYAGRTIVSDGIIEAARVNLIAIPGDAIVGDVGLPPSGGPYSVGLRILRDRQINPNANVILGGDGFFWLQDFPGSVGLSPAPQIRTISGTGLIHIDPNCALTLSNDVPFSFDGSVEGSGLFTKFGSAVMQWTGNNSPFEGTTTIGAGDFLMNGIAPFMPVTVNATGVLRGDGQVNGVTVQTGGGLGADSKFPDHQGGTLDLTTLILSPGSTMSLDFFGPSPTGGNDQIASSFLVTLNNADLLPIFRYPPRLGDVITALNKTSGGAVSGTFHNWPQGTVQSFNGIPVHLSYTGGDGNDITLTVTNLALSFFNYTLVEGNGNQTVEPDECNLLFISLFNRRPSTVTITNAVLRSLTSDALVTIAHADYPPITIGNVAANSTPFQFRTRAGMPCSNVLTFELVLGVLNEGEFALTFSPVSGTDCTHPTGPCESCAVATGHLDTNAPATFQSLLFVGGPSLCFPPKACPGIDRTPQQGASLTYYLTHSFTNSATNEVCVTVQPKINCQAAFNFPRVAAYAGAFDTNDVCANYLGDSGGTGLPPFSFPVPAGSNLVIVVTTRVNLGCPDYTIEVFGLPCPSPVIGIGVSSSPQVALAASPTETTSRAGRKIGISWSTASPGWTAQQAGQVGGTFTDMSQAPVLMDGRYTVTNIPPTTNQFYRLKK